MEKQIIKIEIQSSDGYEFEKTFKKIVQMDEKQFLAFCENILAFLDKEKITNYVSGRSKTLTP